MRTEPSWTGGDSDDCDCYLGAAAPSKSPWTARAPDPLAVRAAAGATAPDYVAKAQAAQRERWLVGLGTAAVVVLAATWIYVSERGGAR